MFAKKKDGGERRNGKELCLNKTLVLVLSLFPTHQSFKKKKYVKMTSK